MMESGQVLTIEDMDVRDDEERRKTSRGFSSPSPSSRKTRKSYIHWGIIE